MVEDEQADRFEPFLNFSEDNLRQVLERSAEARSRSSELRIKGKALRERPLPIIARQTLAPNAGRPNGSGVHHDGEPLGVKGHRMNPALQRHNVTLTGSSPKTMMFAHGFGCDQHMWRLVAPAFEGEYRTLLFDHIGAGGADLTAYDPEKYATLDGYADDIITIAEAANVRGGVFVGHSVSAMIGLLAARRAPELFETLVLVGPSPRYIDDEGYVGGFAEAQIEELLDFLDSNHLGWSQAMAPAIMGNPDRPELGEELTASFCRTDPEIARRFARTTFLSDNRNDLGDVNARILILQTREDVIAPGAVGEYMHRALPGSEFVLMDATGHCPNLSAPEETIAAIKAFL